eukprot:7628106-Pyramimonas_sp.AAC.1
MLVLARSPLRASHFETFATALRYLCRGPDLSSSIPAVLLAGQGRESPWASANHEPSRRRPYAMEHPQGCGPSLNIHILACTD